MRRPRGTGRLGRSSPRIRRRSRRLGGTTAGVVSRRRSGAPGAPGCELGPIGFPVRDLTATDGGGRFSARLRLISPGEPNPGEDLGEVRIVGRFLAGAKAAGTIETRGGPKGCDGTFRWHAAAR